MDSNNYESFIDKDDFKCMMNCDSLLKTGLVVGSSVAFATAVCPTVRKIVVPTCKVLAKQQLKLLAGIGVLSIATYVSKNCDNMNCDYDFE